MTSAENNIEPFDEAPRVPIEPQEPANKYLVVSALAEEMEAFYSLNPAFESRVRVADSTVDKTVILVDNTPTSILTFSSARMGMPHNSAAIMQVIQIHQPVYILFIGTCGSLKKNTKLGSVIVPKTVFNHELGKYKNFSFLSDNESYKMSEEILRHAQSIRAANPDWLGFDLILDDDFSSGSVVVDSWYIRWRIKRKASRKANGLDMESFSLGAIAHLQKLKHVGVIKGVMDLGFGKTDSDKQNAMDNAAKFAYELVQHIARSHARVVIPTVLPNL